jgi:DNA mismatch repair protein MutL
MLPRERDEADAATSAVARLGFSGLRFVGQVFRGYIICEGADRLVLIDQHAAHERVAFERLREQHRAGAIEQQPLLIAPVVTLEPGRAEAIAAAGDRLAALGFDVEPFGDERFLVRALPALLGDDDPQLLLEDLADGLEDVGSQHAADDAVEEILGRIACHSVIRVGRALAPAEIEALLAALDGLAYATNCPHGRPVSVEFTRGQVERMFGR